MCAGFGEYNFVPSVRQKAGTDGHFIGYLISRESSHGDGLRELVAGAGGYGYSVGAFTYADRLSGFTIAPRVGGLNVSVGCQGGSAVLTDLGIACEGQDSGDDFRLGSEGCYFAPIAYIFTTVCTYFDRIFCSGGQTAERISAVLGDIDEVFFVIVEADLPSGGIASLRPSEGRARRGSVANHQVGRCRAEQFSGGEEKAVAPVACAILTAVGHHLNFIGGQGSQTSDGSTVCCATDIHPFASGRCLSINAKIVNENEICIGVSVVNGDVAVLTCI